ncbi:MAG: helix-turn-helix domain-containing protein [Desulfobulbaceae bacterium]|nr:helix-turn-helix domain-containing protein [Desulfobulbaceae bacterium]
MKHRTLSLEEVASLGGVSLARVRSWIKKKVLRAEQVEGIGLRVHTADMIDFLVRYNMAIPESIVPLNAKKILFVHGEGSDTRSFMKFVINFLMELKKGRREFIIDHISYGSEAKMKMMVLRPDLVILDMTGGDKDALAFCTLIKEIEYFSSVKLIGIIDSALPVDLTAAIKKCGIEEVVPVSVAIDPFTRKVLEHYL